MLKMKAFFVVMFLFISSASFGAAEFDRDIVIKKQSRDDKVTSVFNQMMMAYEDESLHEFFSFVSEDRFVQDYMTFYDAIDNDLRAYDILSIDTWVNKIEDDGVKRYLYVKWDKRYTSTSHDNEINQLGYSRFLFDEVDGDYKLIELAGNIFWGGSSSEWREEVPTIAGQEVYTVTQEQEVVVADPDLVIKNLFCSPMYDPAGATIEFDIVNLGGATDSGSVDYFYDAQNDMYDITDTYFDDIGSGETVHISISGECYGGNPATVDPDDLIEESDESNNTTIVTY